MLVLEGCVNGAIGPVDSPSYIGNKVLSDFPDPLLTHFTQPYFAQLKRCHVSTLMAIPQLGQNAARITADCTSALNDVGVLP